MLVPPALRIICGRTGRALRSGSIQAEALAKCIVAPLIAAVDDIAAFHEANGLVLRNPRVANLLDCPSISLPIAGPGLPVGLMLIGRRNSDRRLLAAAACIEAGLGNRSGRAGQL